MPSQLDVSLSSESSAPNNPRYAESRHQNPLLNTHLDLARLGSTRPGSCAVQRPPLRRQPLALNTSLPRSADKVSAGAGPPPPYVNTQSCAARWPPRPRQNRPLSGSDPRPRHIWRTVAARHRIPRTARRKLRNRRTGSVTTTTSSGGGGGGAVAVAGRGRGQGRRRIYKLHSDLARW